MLPTSKSGKPRPEELSSIVLETLKRLPRRLDTPLIFPDCRKVSHRFPGWVTEATLPGKVTLHTLRHTFASRLVMAGVDLLTVKDLGGSATWRWSSVTRTLPDVALPQFLLEGLLDDLFQSRGQGTAEQLAQNRDIAGRVDVLGIDPHLDPDPGSL